MLDEFDHALDSENMGTYIRILKFLSKRSQVFFTSFRKECLNLEEMSIKEVVFDRTSRVKDIDVGRASEIVESFRDNNE